MSTDLFQRIPPGLVPVRRSGRWFICASDAGGYTAWCGARLMAQGAMSTIARCRGIPPEVLG